MGDETTLYRMFDGSGQLLYVGVTATVRGATRFGEHAKGKWWWPDVKALTVEHYMTREAAESAERRAIQSEAPLHNIVHNRRPCRAAAPMPTLDVGSVAFAGLTNPAPAPRVSGWRRPGALVAEAERRRDARIGHLQAQIYRLAVERGRLRELCLDCGSLTSPRPRPAKEIVWFNYIDAIFSCPCGAWWEQTVALHGVGPLPTDERARLGELEQLLEQMQAAAEHGAPLVAPNVEPVVAGLAAHFPRVD